MAKTKNGFYVSKKKTGDKGENQIKDLLEKHGYIVEKSVGKTHDFDLKATKNNKELTFEVKYDVMAAKTGNVAVEYFNCKKNEVSGINATLAMYWVYVFSDGKYYITKTEKLKGYCKTKTPKRIVNGAGDDNADIMLFDKEEILRDIFNELTDFVVGNLIYE